MKYFILCVLALIPGFALGIDHTPIETKPVRKTGNYWNGYKYGDHLHTIFGVQVKDRATGQVSQEYISISIYSDIDLKTGVVNGIPIDPQKIPLYLNGIKYDPEGNVMPSELGSEICRWYAFTGPFRVTKRDDGGYNFDTLDGEEWDFFINYSKQWIPSNAGVAYDLVCTQFNPRLKTIEQCRKLWKLELEGKIKWNWKTRQYDDVPVEQQKPYIPEEINRNLMPTMPPQRNPEIERRMRETPNKENAPVIPVKICPNCR